MEIGISHYLTVSAILFTLGVFGIFLNRKNVIVILMSIELILLSVNLNMVAFSARLVSSILPWVIITKSPSFTAANSLRAKAVGTPMQPWVALPH